MKQSIYNHFVPINDKIICYNAFTDSFVVAKRDSIGDVNCISVDSALYRQFVDNGFLIHDNVNEKQLYIEARTKEIHSTEQYELIINPTMDCNLNCWYCYESHIENSYLSEDLISAIEKHIEAKYLETKFKELILSFFGGEPLLRADIVTRLISIARRLSQKLGFSLSLLSFTTNGTLVTECFLNVVKDYQTSFQITLDGNQVCHDKIRKLKRSDCGTYSTILHAVERILEKLSNKTNVVLRVNMSAANINNMDMILDDIEKFSAFPNFSVGLHRVWQVNPGKINEKKVLTFVSKCQSLGIKCDYLSLQRCLCSCYADYKNEAIINYDGLVFKCTARPFTVENSCGHLDLDGNIICDNDLLNKRLSLPLPQKCLDCNILPSCPKYCSQKLLENSTKHCPINGNYSVNDYIVHNFNNYLIDYKKKLMRK